MFSIFHRQSPFDTVHDIHFSLNNAQYVYDSEQYGLQETSLELQEHRIGIIGCNGSGKSTLLRLLAGTIQCTSGTITLDKEYDIAAKSNKRIVRNATAYLEQDTIPMKWNYETVHHTLRQYIQKNTTTSKTLITQRIREIVYTCNLAQYLYTPLEALPKLYRHRLAIALAQISHPCTILADEPTRGLDRFESTQITQCLLNTQSQVIIATHDSNILKNPMFNISRVIMLDNQRVVADSTLNEVLSYYDEYIRKAISH